MNEAAAVAKPKAESYISVNNIEVIYDHVILVLKGVSLEVPRGGIVALLGANGAGKTTTLRTILGAVRPAQGAVTFNGQRVDGLATDPANRILLQTGASMMLRAGAALHATQGPAVGGSLYFSQLA